VAWITSDHRAGAVPNPNASHPVRKAAAKSTSKKALVRRAINFAANEMDRPNNTVIRHSKQLGIRWRKGSKSRNELRSRSQPVRAALVPEPPGLKRRPPAARLR
jgi:hypothetical protein